MSGPGKSGPAADSLDHPKKYQLARTECAVMRALASGAVHSTVITHRSGLGRATVLRCLRTLEEDGLVTSTPEKRGNVICKRYELAPA